MFLNPSPISRSVMCSFLACFVNMFKFFKVHSLMAKSAPSPNSYWSCPSIFRVSVSLETGSRDFYFVT